MSARPESSLPPAGAFLVAAGLWELVFNRLASAAGYYSDAGANGFASGLALSGRLSMNAAGIMAIALASIELPRIAGSPRAAPLPIRIGLMLASPFYLPILCVSIFRPIHERLVFVAYLFAVCSALLATLQVTLKSRNRMAARTVLLLGIMEALAAFDLLARFSPLYYYVPPNLVSTLPRTAYLLSELLFVAAPIIAFFAFLPGRLHDFLRRPHLPALLASLAATGLAAGVALQASGGEFLRAVAYRALGVTLFIPGGPPLYLASLFMGTLLVGTLVLPSRRWPPTARSIRAGLGLACILMVGVQPTHPYQFAILIAGFFYLARGLEDDIAAPSAPANPIPS